MFKKPTKKARLIRRIVLSAVATLAVIIIVTASVLFMLGYRLDSGNGRLELGALLQFDSTPNGASILLDGQATGDRTASKRTVLAGEHTITYQRSGYEDWSRTLRLEAGTLTWLDYPRLVPTQRVIEPVLAFPELADVLFSPEGRWAIALQSANVPALRLIDLRSEQVSSREIVLPASLYSESANPEVTHRFDIVAWDAGGRYVLMTHMYGDQREWLVIDTQTADQDRNISRALSTNFSDVQFSGTNGRTFYGLSDGVLRKLDLSAGTLSGGLITRVESFSVYETNIVAYVGTNPDHAEQRVAGVYRDGDEEPHVLRTTDSLDTSLRITVGRYFSDDYVAIAEGAKVDILKGSYPGSSSQDVSSLQPFANMELTNAVTDLSFSPESEYVVAQAGASFASYEIEYRRSAAGVLLVPDGAVAARLQWLDDAYLWADTAGSLTMRDFDNANVSAIMPVSVGYDASLSQNGRFFYAVGKSEAGYQLQRVRMILS